MKKRSALLLLGLLSCLFILSACDKKPRAATETEDISENENAKEKESNLAGIGISQDKAVDVKEPSKVVDQRPLVVYCAHDRHLAESVIAKFTKETGIQVNTRFDGETTKSLGLTELLMRERETPRADVFWNNQMLGMMYLAENDVFHPYTGVNHARIPEQFKDAKGAYCGFGGRLRVYILNTEKLKEDADYTSLSKLMQEAPDKFTIAQPLYGTTLSHYSTLWQLWGETKLKKWHHDLLKGGTVIKGGNSSTKNLVAAGSTYAGMTDTDDFYIALDSKAPVKMLPVRIATKTETMYAQQKHKQLDQGKVLLIPNTVGIIKGSYKLSHAKRFIDFLLSEKIEVMLSQGKARQIPLGPVDANQLPQQVQILARLVPQALPLRDYYESRDACVKWLKSELLK